MRGLTARVTASAIVAGMLALAGVVALTAYIAGRPTVLQIAVGPPGREDAKLAQILAQQFARDRSPLRLRLQLRETPLDAAGALESGKADLAIVRGDLGVPKNAQAIAILRRNVAVFIVPPPQAAAREPKPAKKKQAAGGRKATKAAAGEPGKADNATESESEADSSKSETGKIADLIGKRIGVLGRHDFNIRLLHAVLKQYDIAPDKVAVVQLDAADVPAAIKEKRIDALLAVGPVGSSLLAEAVALASPGDRPAKFIDIGEAEALAQRAPIYESSEIVAGTFGGSPPRPPEKVSTIGFSQFIVARRSLSEQTAYEFARLLFGARQVLAAESPAFGKIEVPDTDRDAAVPVHPGALAYIEGDQKTFFDRYGDLMYWGVMLLSFFGSGAAGFASYLNSGERMRSNQHLDRLVQIVTASRVADADELNALQLEVDAILASTVRQAEGAKLSADSLAAFTLALNQARLAIEQRRVAPLGEPARRRPGAAEAIALR